MRSIIVPTNSGSATRQQSTNGREESNRKCESSLRDATMRMWKNVKAIPEDVQNIVYRFTSYEGRYRDSLLGPYPRVARSLAESGASLSDVMSPAFELQSQLRREVYGQAVPSLEVIEQEQADIVCKIQHAEISNDAHSLKEAAREEIIVAELLEQAADRAVHETGRCAVIGGTK